MERRNDPKHFRPVNGAGHRPRKLINLPEGHRHYVVDPVEAEALELVDQMQRFLAADAARKRRFEQARGIERGGDPGE